MKMVLLVSDENVLFSFLSQQLTVSESRIVPTVGIASMGSNNRPNELVRNERLSGLGSIEPGLQLTSESST